MHTEDEAKKLWCPHARVLGTLQQPAKPGDPDFVVGQGGQNRGYQMGGGLSNCNCIASKCSQWRPVAEEFVPADPPQTLMYYSTNDRKPPVPDSDHRWIVIGSPAQFMWQLVKLAPRKGYCGLAGKP